MLQGLVQVITIDGPSGSGKGTLSFMLSRKLSWNLLDSGALYRVLAYACENKKINFLDEVAVVEIAKNLDVHFRTSNNGEVLSIFRNVDISKIIRTEEYGNYASQIASMPFVRDALNLRQKQFRKMPGLVADGRDMGTVVFPDAKLKIFLSADEEVRATRRHQQLMEKGENVSLGRLRGDIEARDRRDTTRKVSPLVKAEGALNIDSSKISALEVFERAMLEVRRLDIL